MPLSTDSSSLATIEIRRRRALKNIANISRLVYNRRNERERRNECVTNPELLITSLYIRTHNCVPWSRRMCSSAKKIYRISPGEITQPRCETRRRRFFRIRGLFRRGAPRRVALACTMSFIQLPNHARVYFFISRGYSILFWGGIARPGT